MRRTLLALLAPLLALAPAAAADEGGAAAHLQRIRGDHTRLQQFLWDLPKGGDVHSHLSGAVYAEAMVAYGARDGDCVDLLTMTALDADGACPPGARKLSDALSDNDFYNRIMRAWSMKGFVEGANGESGHDHFFATFDKFGGALDGHVGEGLGTVAERARAQHEHYLELLTTPRFGDVSRLARDVPYDPANLAATRVALLAAGLRDIVPRAGADLDAVLAQEQVADPSPVPAIRFQVQVLRAMPPNVVFAQLVFGFELMARDPRWVGVNMVQPEDAEIALRDYRLHMRMIGFLHDLYPGARITLHAGELAPGVAPPADLRFHIREAVETANADRIGHGVAIRWERDPIGLLKRMARDGIAVETPLSSNRQILRVWGKRHPFNLYRRYGVPVLLATDDEGVARTDLTEQYRQAVLEHGAGYRALKKISLDQLRYSFLPDGEKAALLRRLDAAFDRLERRYG